MSETFDQVFATLTDDIRSPLETRYVENSRVLLMEYEL